MKNNSTIDIEVLKQEAQRLSEKQIENFDKLEFSDVFHQLDQLKLQAPQAVVDRIMKYASRQ
jgi:CxxC motif-containing protein